MSTITGVFSSSLAQMVGMSADGSIRVGSAFDTVKTKAMELGNKMQEMQNNGTFIAWGDKVSQTVTGIGNAMSFAKDTIIAVSPAIAALTAAYIAHKGIVIASTAAHYAHNAAMTVSNGLIALQCARIEYQTIVAAGGSKTLGVITAAQWLWNAAMTANPIGAVIVGVAALVAGIVVLVKNWDKVTAAVKRAWEWLTRWRNGGGETAIAEAGSLPQVEAGQNARGTAYWRGGLTWVGEKGPELVNLPRGAEVFSNQKSLSLIQSIKQNIIPAKVNPVRETAQTLPPRKSISELNAALTNTGGASSLPAYSPQVIIQGNADENIITKALDMSFEKYKQYARKYEAEKRRLQFSPS